MHVSPAERRSFSRLVDAVTNCSTPTRVPPARLAEALRSGDLAPAAGPQLVALFTEVSLGTLLGFAAEQAVSYGALARSYRRMKECYGERNLELEEWFAYLEIAPANGPAAAG